MLTRYVRENLVWIDCVSPTPAEVRGLMHEFGIDPLIAEELLLPSYKPKVEKRGDVIYVILHFPIMRSMHQTPEQEIDFLIGKNFLITTRYENVDPLHSFAKAFEVAGVLGTDTATLTEAICLSLWCAISTKPSKMVVATCTAAYKILKGIFLAATNAAWLQNFPKWAAPYTTLNSRLLRTKKC